MTDSIVSDTTPGGLTEEDSEKLFKDVLACEPAMAIEMLDEFADLPRSNERFGRQWRSTAVLATKGGDFYRKLSDDASMAKVMAPMVYILTDFAKVLREAAELADRVAARVMIAGCGHEDFIEWMKDET